MLNKLTIKNKPNKLGLYDILLDDKPIKCTSIVIEASVDSFPPQATITLQIPEIEITDIIADVEYKVETKRDDN